MFKNIKRYSFIVLTIFFSFILSDLVFTKIFYNFFFKENLKKSTNIGNVRVTHPVFHHHMKENSMQIENHQIRGVSKLITNSLGFKDKENRKIDYKTKKKRIIFLGDSFTEGIFLNYEDTFVGIIDNYFKNKDPSVEVLNAGVSSYSPTIYYHKIKYFLEKGLELNHLVVFIDISDVENEAINYKYNKENNAVETKEVESSFTLSIYASLIRFLKKNLYLSYTVLNSFKDKLLPTPNQKYLTQKQFIKYTVSNRYVRDKWTINKSIFNRYKLGIKKSLENMSLLKDLCKKNNIKLTIVVYPWISQIFHKDLNSKQVEIWKKFSKKNNNQFINLFPIFVNDKDNKKQIYNKIRKNFIPFDVHYNSRGNKIIAESFLKVFKY